MKVSSTSNRLSQYTPNIALTQQGNLTLDEIISEQKKLRENLHRIINPTTRSELQLQDLDKRIAIHPPIQSKIHREKIFRTLAAKNKQDEDAPDPQLVFNIFTTQYLDSLKKLQSDIQSELLDTETVERRKILQNKQEMLNRLITQLQYNVKYGLGPKETLTEEIKRANSNIVLLRGKRRSPGITKTREQQVMEKSEEIVKKQQSFRNKTILESSQLQQGGKRVEPSPVGSQSSKHDQSKAKKSLDNTEKKQKVSKTQGKQDQVQIPQPPPSLGVMTEIDFPDLDSKASDDIKSVSGQENFVEDVYKRIRHTQTRLDQLKTGQAAWLRKQFLTELYNRIEDFESSSDSEEGHLFTVVKKPDIFGRGCERSFFSGKNIQGLKCPDEILERIQPSYNEFNYKIPVVVPPVQIGDAKIIPLKAVIEQFIICMSNRGKNLTVLEANLAYCTTCFIVRKYPEIIFRHQQRQGYIERIYLYLPNYCTTAEIVNYSKIQAAEYNGFLEKQSPRFAMIGLDLCFGRYKSIDRAGNLAIPFQHNNIQLFKAVKIITIRNGIRRIQFDDFYLRSVIENMVNEVKKVFCN